MIDFILGKFTEITSNCLEKNAKEYGTQKSKMQLVFKLGNDGEVEYLIYKDYQFIKKVTFLQVLGVKLDFKGYSLFVPNFIKGALERFSGEFEIDRDKVKTMLYFGNIKVFDEITRDEMDKEGLIIWLTNDNQYVKQVELESLFDSEDMIEE